MGIGIAITLRDRFTANANRVMGQMERMNDNVGKIMQKNLQMIRNVSLGVAGLGVLMLMPVQRAISEASKFNYVITSVGAVTQDTKISLEELSKLALQVGEETIHTADQVADAMKYLGMAGFNREQIAQSIRPIAQLSMATDTAIGGVGGTADIASNILQQFNLEAHQTAYVADLLSATVTRANTDLQSLGQAIYYAGGQFSSMNIPLEEALAFAGVISGSGYRGSFAGTSMLNMLQQLMKAMGEFRTANQSKVLEGMGLRPEDVFMYKEGLLALKPIEEVIENIGKNLDAGIMKASQVDALFQKRGARGFIAALRDPKIGMNLREFGDFLRSPDRMGTAMTIAEKKMATFEGQVERLKSTLHTLRVNLGLALIPILMPFVKILTSMASVLAAIVANPIGKWVAIAVVGFITLGTILAGITTMLSTLAIIHTQGFISMKAMAQTMAYYWNYVSARLMRYLLLQRGVGNNVVMNSAGRLINRATGRFVPTPTPVAGGMFSGNFTAMFSRFGAVLGRVIPNLLKFGRFLLGPVGIIGSIMVYLIGFKNLLRGVLYALATWVHWIYYQVEVALSILEKLFNPNSWFNGRGIFDDANENWARRQAIVKKNLDMYLPGEKNPAVPKYTKYNASYAEDMRQAVDSAALQNVANKLGISTQEARSRTKMGQINVNTVLQVGPQEIVRATAKYQDNEIQRLFSE